MNTRRTFLKGLAALPALVGLGALADKIPQPKARVLTDADVCDILAKTSDASERAWACITINGKAYRATNVTFTNTR